MAFQVEAQSCVPGGFDAPRNGGRAGCRAPEGNPAHVEGEGALNSQHHRAWSGLFIRSNGLDRAVLITTLFHW